MIPTHFSTNCVSNWNSCRESATESVQFERWAICGPFTIQLQSLYSHNAFTLSVKALWNHEIESISSGAMDEWVDLFFKATLTNWFCTWIRTRDRVMYHLYRLYIIHIVQNIVGVLDERARLNKEQMKRDKIMIRCSDPRGRSQTTGNILLHQRTRKKLFLFFFPLSSDPIKPFNNR